jgi:hypothetical protein
MQAGNKMAAAIRFIPMMRPHAGFEQLWRRGEIRQATLSSQTGDAKNNSPRPPIATIRQAAQ